MNRVLLVWVIFLLLFSRCTAPQPSIHAYSPGSARPMILSMILSLQLSGSERDIVIVDRFFGPGRLKTGSPDINEPQPGDLRCSFLGARKNALQQIIVPDPLRQHLEYATGDGQLRQVRIEKTSQTFNIRVQWQEEMRFMKIDLLDQEKKWRQLAILPVEKGSL